MMLGDNFSLRYMTPFSEYEGNKLRATVKRDGKIFTVWECMSEFDSSKSTGWFDVIEEDTTKAPRSKKFTCVYGGESIQLAKRFAKGDHTVKPEEWSFTV